MNKISESSNWANLIDENGLNGGDTSHLIDYSKCVENRRKTVADDQWRKTVLTEQLIKERKTKSSPQWIETIGKKRAEEQSKSISNTMNDPQWIETIGKNARKKTSETMKTKEWKLKHQKKCEYCSKGPMPKGVYNKWHGENCKNKK